MRQAATLVPMYDDRVRENIDYGGKQKLWMVLTEKIALALPSPRNLNQTLYKCDKRQR